MTRESNDMIIGYYYLHTNGSLIYKPRHVVDYDPDYFNSPFVQQVWPVNPVRRETAWKLVVEAARMGANQEDIDRLRSKWNLTSQDAIIYADQMGYDLFETEDDRWGLVNRKTKEGCTADTAFGALVACQF